MDTVTLKMVCVGVTVRRHKVCHGGVKALQLPKEKREEVHVKEGYARLKIVHPDDGRPHFWLGESEIRIGFDPEQVGDPFEIDKEYYIDIRVAD